MRIGLDKALTRPHPVVFTPASLSNVVSIADPSDLSSMFQLGNGTTAAAVDSPVGYLGDKSGNARHATQATAGQRPVLRSDGTYRWLEFSAASFHALQAPALSMSASDKATIWLAFEPADGIGSVVLETSADTNANNGAFHISANGAVAGQIGIGARGGTVNEVNRTVATAYGVGIRTILTVSLDLSQASLANKTTARRNGVAEPLTGTDGADTASNFLDHVLNVGARGGTGSYFSGKVFGWVIRRGLSSPQEMAAVEAWLRQRTPA